VTKFYINDMDTLMICDDVVMLIREDAAVSLILSFTCKQYGYKHKWTRELTRLVVTSCSLENLILLGMDLPRLAAEYGRIDLLKWIRDSEYDYPYDDKICAFAADGGQLKSLKWLRYNGHPWDKDTCTYAARIGDLRILKWARQNGCPWDEVTCAYAASDGHLEVLKWLHENNCPWNEDTCAYAALGGHLEILKWLHERGCPWNKNTCTNAATNGHLEVLKWVQRNGCPWDKYTCIEAAKNRNLEVLLWAWDHGCDWDHNICSHVAMSEYLMVLRTLPSKGIPLNHHVENIYMMFSIIICGCLDFFKSVQEHGLSWYEDIWDDAFQQGLVVLYEWIDQVKSSNTNAVKYKYLEILNWSRNNGCPLDLINDEIPKLIKAQIDEQF
jgi:hypothetical protein